MHEAERRCALLLAAAGAVLQDDVRVSLHRSAYITLRCGDRRVTLRGSDHHNFDNPRAVEKVRAAATLRYTAPGFERALALWLGWSENQVAGLKLATKRDQKILAAKPREEVAT